MYAWFDSGDNWTFVGGLIDRYYNGPRVLMVRLWPRTEGARVKSGLEHPT